MFQTILIALDDAIPASAVAAVCQQLHLDQQHQVILTHVMALNDEDWDATRAHAAMDVDPERAEQRLLDYQAQLPCPSKIEISQGDPAAEIVRLAKIYGVDLIILGSRGLTGLKRILQKSVSAEVLEEAPCAVLVLKTATGSLG